MRTDLIVGAVTESILYIKYRETVLSRGSKGTNFCVIVKLITNQIIMWKGTSNSWLGDTARGNRG